MKLNLSEYHPILDIQNHVVFASNGNVVLCYKTELPEIYSLSEADFDELHGIWFQAFKSLPTGTVIHRQDLYQKLGYDAKALPNVTFLEKATHDYFKGREHLDHKSYLFFILPLDKTLNAAKYVNPFKKNGKRIAPKARCPSRRVYDRGERCGVLCKQQPKIVTGSHAEKGHIGTHPCLLQRL